MGFRAKLGTSSLGRFKLGDVAPGESNKTFETIENVRTGVPTLIDESIVAGDYVAEVVENTRTAVPSLLNDGNEDLLTSTRTSVPSLLEVIDIPGPDTLTSTRTGVPTITEIIDSTVNTLTSTRTGVPSLLEIIDSTIDTLTATATNVPTISERFIDPRLQPPGPGTGGETTGIKLAPSGVTITASLTASITANAGTLHVDDASGFPDTGGFVIRVEDEEIYVAVVSGNILSGCHRAMGNTTGAVHNAGVAVAWNDTYNLTVISKTALIKEATAPPTLDPIFLSGGIFHGFITIIDCTQAYQPDGDRYATHVRSFVGIFPPGVGSGNLALSKTDGPQGNAVSAIDGVTDRVPVALSKPGRMIEDIEVGDVAICRYKNNEAYILELGPRSVLGQSWYGFIRVTDTNNAALDDPDANIIDGTTKETYADSDPLITAVMPASRRFFTNPARGYSDPGLMLGALAVRQGQRRVPYWTSPNWHNFDWVFTGFGLDRNFVQCVARRKNVDLPSSDELQGPNVTWDDPTYLTSTSWDVVILGYTAEAVIAGPALNGNPPPNTPAVIVTPPGTGGTGGGGDGGEFIPPTNPDEGGSGGNISSAGQGLFVASEPIALPLASPNVPLP